MGTAGQEEKEVQINHFIEGKAGFRAHLCHQSLENPHKTAGSAAHRNIFPLPSTQKEETLCITEINSNGKEMPLNLKIPLKAIYRQNKSAVDSCIFSFPCMLISKTKYKQFCV